MSAPVDALAKRLERRVAIVTGGGHGLGRAYARRLGQEGAAVVVADIDGIACDAVAKELDAEGITSLPVTTDVGDPESVENLMAQARDRFGRVDILVNNAAIMKTVPFEMGGLEEISAADFARVLRVNVIGTWLCTKYVAPIMRERGYGKIINISSTRALRVPIDRPIGLQYPTSKAAIIQLTRECATELGPQGIRVNAVVPGSTLSDDVITEDALERARVSAQAKERPLGLPELPEDLVGAIAFFASPDSDFITGQILVVDGGGIMH